MALVTAPCLWLAGGFTITITYDDQTELVDSLTVTNPTDQPVTLGFTVGSRSGTRVVPALTGATVVVPPGRAPRAGETVNIWAV